ncbi:MAG: hypothetical protein ACRD50_14965 [Candidatus Acidiferrales bacterium]
MLDRFREFLETIPLSASRQGFEQLEIRAVGPEETPVFEKELRSRSCTAVELTEIASEFLHSDCAYETSSRWSLWTLDPETFEWHNSEERIAVICRGEDYDGNAASEYGHIQVDAGFEHFFTGHAGILRRNSSCMVISEHPAESKFRAWMSHPEHLRIYYEKTRENIRQLYGWLERAAKALAPERYLLWSEGEENFEACLEEILAAR